MAFTTLSTSDDFDFSISLHEAWLKYENGRHTHYTDTWTIIPNENRLMTKISRIRDTCEVPKTLRRDDLLRVGQSLPDATSEMILYRSCKRLWIDWTTTLHPVSLTEWLQTFVWERDGIWHLVSRAIPRRHNWQLWNSLRHFPDTSREWADDRKIASRRHAPMSRGNE